MKKFLALLLFLPLAVEAQPTPGLIDSGSPGQIAVYTSTHRLSPGTAGNTTNAAIPLSSITQSGASGGQVAQWNGSAWVPTSPTNGTAIPITIQATNFVLNTVYTNNSGTVIGVDASIALHGAAVVGSSAMDLYADQNGGNNFTLQDRVAVSTLLTSIVTDYTNSLSGFITNLGTYYFTNSSTGAGNLSSIVPGTGEVVTFGNIFAAGNVTLTTVINSFLTDQYFTQIYVQTNFVNYTSSTNSFITYLTDVYFSGKAYLNLTVATNLPGTGYGHKTLTTPTSQGTNWVFDGSQATVFTVKMTNDMYVPYVTNSSTLGASGIMFSVKLRPNGADRLLSLNSNICILDTNGWTLNSSLNPGVWQRTITNAVTTAGGRVGWLSFDCDDAAYNQTNVVAMFKLSP